MNHAVKIIIRKAERPSRFNVAAALYREGEELPHAEKQMAFEVTLREAEVLDRAYTQMALLAGLSVIA